MGCHTLNDTIWQSSLLLLVSSFTDSKTHVTMSMFFVTRHYLEPSFHEIEAPCSFPALKIDGLRTISTVTMTIKDKEKENPLD